LIARNEIRLDLNLVVRNLMIGFLPVRNKAVRFYEGNQLIIHKDLIEAPVAEVKKIL
jgi:hypothetical protein